MLKIPISALCEEDALLIKKERASPDVKRFKLTTITVPDGSPLAKRFKRVGFNELKFEALVFAKGVSTSGEPVQYVQLYPGGQICEMPMGGSLLKENPTEFPRNLGMSKVSDADAVKGPTWVLEQKIKERSLAKEEAERKAREAEEIERRRLYEKPFRDAFDRLRVELEETAYKMELCNTERHCEVHQWKTCYAPTVEQQSAYGANYMNALELLKKGLLKCSCNSLLIQQYEEAKKECHALENKMQELQKTHPEIDFLKEVYY